MVELSPRTGGLIWYGCIRLGSLTIIATAIVVFPLLVRPVIYLAYARNIARGDFFSYSPGEFWSGTTSTLWGRYPCSSLPRGGRSYRGSNLLIIVRSPRLVPCICDT